ncbi:branched-chain amino acid ABC transporter substrate-binding protein [Herbaspirillum sp. WKF16]|uniref:branched-chain amino acid ABC transporter substrate-binding protein n=1 Tax=Herbaspirillum sp. WKF16 TaxID=3028312 RepID=UPI0023A9AA6C|nr:branched-chain amino acid ABC transporter substrate-binding protein [Herbaspirillum sp. WKF16]WDZ96076.1 branched-chain amino acid ABC transporter substrate-binding protein [Herbaspirillum sp. WKF16]
MSRTFPRLHKRAAALCCLSLYVLPCLSGAAPAQQPKTILIGFSGALGGVSEQFGKSQANAAEMALIEANRHHPRIGGQPVFFRLLRHDDHNQPEAAAAVARQLLKAGVAAVIGTTDSGTARVAAKIYSDAGVALLSPAASAAALAEQGNAGFFSMIGHDGHAGAYLADYAMHELNMRRIAVIDNGSMYGMAAAATVHERICQAGFRPVLRERVGYASDLQQLAWQIRQSGAQGVFFGGYAQAASLARALHRTGRGPRLMLASSGEVGSPFLVAARSAAAEVLAIEPGLPETGLPGWRRFERDYRERFGADPYGLAPFAYDAAQVLLAAIRQGDSAEPGKIIEALRQIRFKGLTGTVAFDEAGYPRHPLFTVYTVRDRHWVPLRTYEGPPRRAENDKGCAAAAAVRR